MSASIPSLLADKLDISDEQAKKLLVAMLREVKKRAFREGVCLPELGTFRGKSGKLTFEPNPSLARTVNEQFEGLESEGLATAPEPESEEEDTDDGPDTITLGYQDSDWSPLASEESTEEGDASEDGEDDGPDTAEFQVPSAEEAADTSKLQAQEEVPAQEEAADEDSTVTEDDTGVHDDTSASARDSSASRTSEATSSSDSPTSENAPAPSDRSSEQNEDLYPLVEDAPDRSEQAEDEVDDQEDETPDSPPDQRQRERDEEHASLSEIWNSDEDEDGEEEDPFEPMGDAVSETKTASSSDAPTEPESVFDGASTPSETSSASDTESASMEVPEVEEEYLGREKDPASSDSPSEPSTSEDDRSSTARFLVGTLVILMLGGAGWYVLGQRGTVPTPRTTFTQLNSQLQPLVKSLPVVGSSEEGTASAPGSSGSQSSESGADSTPTGAETASGSSATGSDAESSDTDAATRSTTESEASSSTPSTGPQQTSSQDLNPSAGGYTIVVASRTQRIPAEELVRNYREALSSQDVPIGLLTGEAEGQTRYRIGVGQFSSRSTAQSFLEKAGDKLPDGAWVLSL